MKDSVLPGLKPIREKLGFSQEKLGAEASSSGEAISNIETGARGASLALLKRITAVLCCSSDDLLSPQDPERLQEIKDAFEIRKGEEAKARQAERDQQKGAA